MMTVRFASGLSVQYNEALFVGPWGTEAVSLRDKEGGRAIAIVPHAAGAIIELQRPCRVYRDTESDINALRVQIERARATICRLKAGKKR